MEPLEEKVVILETQLGHVGTTIDQMRADNQRHVHELRNAHNALTIKQETYERSIEERLRSIERLLYMGLGGLFTLQIVLKFIKFP